MEKKETEYFKGVLEKELALLQKELASVGRVNPENPKDWEPMPEEHDPKQADENEIADNIEAFEEHTAILKDLEIRFNEVKGALKKIEEGTYGICEVSGEPIEHDRLVANPAARTCKAHITET